MSSKDSSCDVAVIGGGPSGMLAAITVAKAGYSVVLLDKKPHDKIGEKNCGEALDAKHANILLEESGITLPSFETGELTDPISHISIVAGPLENKISSTSPGFLVDRLLYGQRLLEIAEKEGVKIMDRSHVRGPIVNTDEPSTHISGVQYLSADNEERELHAKITIDGSGYSGILREKIPSELTSVEYTIPDEYSIVAYREIIEFEKEHSFPEEIVWIYHREIPPPGYIWVFSAGKKRLNLGICWVKSIPYPDGMGIKDLYHKYLAPYMDQPHTIINKGGGKIPMRPNFDSMVVNGAMLVGDAACHADPTTFEGIGPALESGRLAGLAAVEALEKGDYSAEALWPYNTNIMAYPGGMHAQSFVAAQLLSDIGADGLQFLLERQIITEEELVSIFQEKQSLSLAWKIKKLIMAFPRWGLMLKIKRYVDLIESVGEIYENYPKEHKGLDEWIQKRDKILKI